MVTVVSRPVIQSITVTNNVATVTWSAIAGESYRLQYTDSFTSTNWTELLPDVSAIGTTATTTNELGEVAQRFFRVLVVP